MSRLYLTDDRGRSSYGAREISASGVRAEVAGVVGRARHLLPPAMTIRAPKYYNLVMFPYPSGDLHIGHWYNYTGADIYGRYMRMRGYNVTQPIGFDAFGLPAENAAIKRNIQPRTWTLDNIAKMRGADCARWALAGTGRARSSPACPTTTRWTQWLFLQFYKHGLAYRTKAPANWCPTCNTTLANEQVVNGALRALRHAGRAARDRPVAAAHHQVRRRAAALRWHGLAREDAADADQLDWAQRGRRDPLPRRAPTEARQGNRAHRDSGLHDAARHDLRRDLLRAGAGASAGGAADHAGAARGGARLRRAGAARDRDRAPEHR